MDLKGATKRSSLLGFKYTLRANNKQFNENKNNGNFGETFGHFPLYLIYLHSVSREEKYFKRKQKNKTKQETGAIKTPRTKTKTRQ